MSFELGARGGQTFVGWSQAAMEDLCEALLAPVGGDEVARDARWAWEAYDWNCQESWRPFTRTALSADALAQRTWVVRVRSAGALAVLSLGRDGSDVLALVRGSGDVSLAGVRAWAEALGGRGFWEHWLHHPPSTAQWVEESGNAPSEDAPVRCALWGGCRDEAPSRRRSVWARHHSEVGPRLRVSWEGLGDSASAALCRAWR